MTRLNASVYIVLGHAHMHAYITSRAVRLVHLTVRPELTLARWRQTSLSMQKTKSRVVVRAL